MLKVTLKNIYDDSEWTEERRHFIYDNWPGLRPTKPKEQFGRYDLPRNEMRMSWEEVQFFLENDIPLELEADKGTMLTTMRDRAATGKLQTDFETAKVVQFSIPDIGLLQIQQVTWLEDACTEDLQSYLDAGWRILAVCPPNAQRRPDYILGRRDRVRE